MGWISEVGSGMLAALGAGWALGAGGAKVGAGGVAL